MATHCGGFGFEHVAVRTAPPSSGVEHNSPMRLLLVISSMGGGGAERVMSRLASAWAASGVQVTLSTFESQARDFFEVPEPVARRSWTDEESSRPSRLPGAIRRERWLRHLIRQSQPDAVISFTDRTNVLVLLAARGLRVPVIVSERTDPTMCSPGRLWSLGRKLTYPHASAIVVQTGRVLDWARSQFPGTRSLVIPNPAPPLSPVECPPTSQTIVAVGRLGPEKGFDLLIEAFSRVAARWPDWKLRILGEGSARAALESQVQDLGLSQRVSLPGQCHEAIRQIAAAEIFALSSRLEGFPNVLVEAMSTGRAVVAFDCHSGPADLIESEVNGLLVPAGDLSALAAALDRLMGNLELRSRLGATAQLVRERLSLPSILGQWNELLQSVGAGRLDSSAPLRKSA